MNKFLEQKEGKPGYTSHGLFSKNPLPGTQEIAGLFNEDPLYISLNKALAEKLKNLEKNLSQE